VENIPTELVDRITASEGIRLMPGRDSLGILAIGIGHNLSIPITVGAADRILMDDLARASVDLEHALPWVIHLDGVRYWTLVELAFNMGLGVSGGQHGLLSFTHTLLAIETARFVNAAEGLLQSAWAEEVGDTRIKRIATQIRTGAWA
jgi:lysozyme